MKKIFNLLKEKLNKFSFKIFLILFGAAIVVSLFSSFIGDILLLTSALYLVMKGIVPKTKNIFSKIANFTKQTYSKFKDRKRTKSAKKITLFKSKKKNVTKTEIKKEKKNIPNIIKNFKLLSTDKFNFNLKIKKDVNGCKIVDGSYRIKGNKIIDNKINLYTLEPIVDNETTYSHKTYVKTK